MNGHTSELTLPGLHRTAFPPALAPPGPLNLLQEAPGLVLKTLGLPAGVETLGRKD